MRARSGGATTIVLSTISALAIVGMASANRPAAARATKIVARPAVTRLSSAAVDTHGGTRLTIHGQNFRQVKAVALGSAKARSVRTASATTIQLTVPAHKAGRVDVRVRTAAGWSAVSRRDVLSFVAAPSVLTVRRSSGTEFGGTKITITGHNFRSVRSVRFGRAAGGKLSVGSTTSLTVTAPRHVPGRVDVTVTTAFGTSSVVTAGRFTYTAPGVLPAGRKLYAGQYLRSPNGAAIYQLGGDGNSCVDVRSAPVWCTDTAGHPGGFATVGDDGNFTLNQPRGNYWAAGTNGFAGAYLAVGDDGSLGVYDGQTGRPLWQQGTTSTGVYVGNMLRSGDRLAPGEMLRAAHGTAIYQVGTDGNSCVGVNAAPVWCTNTAGHTNGAVVMGGDGNFTLDQPSGNYWSAGTDGFTGAYLALGDDSNLGVYDKQTGRPLWQRGTTAAGTYVGNVLPAGSRLEPGEFLRSPQRHAIYQIGTDGNSCVGVDGSPTWCTNTAGHPGGFVALGTDGNLTLNQATGTYWQTSTVGHPGAFAAVGDDGAFRVYGNDGQWLWSKDGVGGPAAPSGGVIGDDYPAYLANATQDSKTDPWNFLNRECTSFVAWRLNHVNGVGFTNYYRGQHWGNANHWGTAARSAGIRVDTTPTRGAVAWSTSGDFGHVAWVADVRADGSLDIEQYNYGVQHGRYSTEHVSRSRFTGFIHINDV